ncbi:magnesium transporter CorA family protein [Wohlfahrtiimonas larvae]|uniref:Magnesium transporter CorA family protein n=1 Tax=Wohlfahrtiimonas larvae TaxID=1157986 RepID=A0ABP9MG21_9GAMM|nr:magnesium transporter CorA family protein [Wohlfahrtiimonas larvae]
MFTIYKNDMNGQLVQINSIEHNSLINMVNPTIEEIQLMAKTLELPIDFFSNLLDEDERPRIERNPNGLLMILNVPVKVEGAEDLKQAPYSTVPVGIIHAQDHLVIISRQELDVVREVIEGQYGDFQSYMKTRISLLLFKAVSESYEDHLALVNHQVADLQKELRLSYRNTELFGLINLNKSLVFFSTALSAMAILYKRIAEGDTFKIHDEERKRLQSILVDLEQSAEVIEMRRESLSNLMDAYATIIHNNLNSVLKMLTTLAIVMIIPTMIGSIFSMNVALPGEDNPITTVVVGLGMVVISVVLLIVFYQKKYLRM